MRARRQGINASAGPSAPAPALADQARLYVVSTPLRRLVIRASSVLAGVQISASTRPCPMLSFRPSSPSFASAPAIAARALEFRILTATRSGETLAARWNEFDLEARVDSSPGAVRRPRGSIAFCCATAPSPSFAKWKLGGPANTCSPASGSDAAFRHGV
jgi:hypothetical protein